MTNSITKEQLEELEIAKFFDQKEFHELLKKYTGITAKSYTAYSYYDEADNYIGDSDN